MSSEFKDPKPETLNPTPFLHPGYDVLARKS